MRHLATLAVIALACVLSAPLAASAWGVVTEGSVTSIVRAESDTQTVTVRVYNCTAQTLNKTVLADGSYDNTGGANFFAGAADYTFSVPVTDTRVDIAPSIYARLIHLTVGGVERTSVIVNGAPMGYGRSGQYAPLVNVDYVAGALVPTTTVVVSNPTTSVAVSAMPTRTIDVTGTVAVSSLNASLSLPSTLTVTPDEGSASELRLVGVLFCFCLAVWLFVWAFSGRRVSL
jgi:hypothetical protein